MTWTVILGLSLIFGNGVIAMLYAEDHPGLAILHVLTAIGLMVLLL